MSAALPARRQGSTQGDIMTTPALQLAVRRAYDVFGGRAAPSEPLNVCIGCCMSPELELEMRTLPLNKLTARHFYEYATGAMGDLAQPAQEVAYLLPRWLDLLASGEETHHSVEVALDRVGRCPPGSFDEEETGVLDEFMLAYFVCHLNGGGFWGWSADPVSFLTMADIVGCAVPPLLQCWLKHSNPVSTVRFVETTYWEFWSELRITNAFAEDRPGLQSLFRDWMLAPDTKAAFAAKLLQPDFLALAEQTRNNYRVPFPVMVEAVFDHLSH
jgi:hypothetical protein